jgi:hypothetical protein
VQMVREGPKVRGARHNVHQPFRELSGDKSGWELAVGKVSADRKKMRGDSRPGREQSSAKSTGRVRQLRLPLVRFSAPILYLDCNKISNER